MAVIENLDIVLAANTSKVDAGFDYVGRAAKNLGGKLSGAAQGLASFEPSLPLLGRASGLLAGLGPAALAAGAAIGAMAVTVGVVAKAFDVLQGKVREQFVEIDALGKSAGKIGIAADELAALRHAGEQFSGAQADQVDDAIKELRLRIAEAEMTGTGAAFDAMNQMGLNIGELAAMAPVEQFKAVAAAINESATAGERLFLAEEMMGDAGSVLMETLAKGPEELQEAFDWAQKFGLALSDAQVQGVETMNASLNKVALLFEGFANTIAVEIAPAITVIANDLLKWIENSDGFGNSLQNLGLHMAALYGGSKDVLQILVGLAKFSLGQFDGVIDVYEGAKYESTQQAIDEYLKQVEAAAAAAANSQVPAPNTDAIKAETEKLKTEADKLSERFADPSTKLQETIDRIGQMGAEGLISDVVAMQATQEALAAFGQDIAGLDVTGDLSENLGLAIDEIRQAFETGLIDADMANSLAKQLQDTFGKSIADANMTGDLSTDLANAMAEVQQAFDNDLITREQFDNLSASLRDALADFKPGDSLSGSLRSALTEAEDSLSTGLIDYNQFDAIAAQLRDSFGASLSGLPVDQVAAELQAALESGAITRAQFDELSQPATPAAKDPPSFGALQAGSAEAYKQALANDRAANPQLSELKKQTAKQDQANAKLDAIIDNTANQFQMEGV